MERDPFTGKVVNPSPKTPMSSGQGAVIIVLLCAGLGLPFASLLKPTPQWEYVIKSFPDELLAASMDEYGRNGWELVFARRAQRGGVTSPDFGYEFIFKRPKSLK